MEWVWYFAYSLHMDRGALERLGVPAARRVPGRLPNYRLVFNVLEDRWFYRERRGLANIVPARGHTVEGILCRIPESGVGTLDLDAGVSELKYYRKRVRVRADGDVVEAIAYAAWPDATSEGLRPSPAYLNRLAEAADLTGVSADYREWLRAHPTHG